MVSLVLFGCGGADTGSGAQQDELQFATSTQALGAGEMELCVVASNAPNAGTNGTITLLSKDTNAQKWSCTIDAIARGERKCCTDTSASATSGLEDVMQVEVPSTDGLLFTGISRREGSNAEEVLEGFHLRYSMNPDVRCLDCDNGRDCKRCWVDENGGEPCNKAVIDFSSKTIECKESEGSQSHGFVASSKQLCVQASGGTYSGTNNDVSLEYTNSDGSRKWACTITSNIGPGELACCTDNYAAYNFGRNRDRFVTTVHGTDGLEVTKTKVGSASMSTFSDGSSALVCYGCSRSGSNCDRCWIDENGHNNVAAMRLEWKDSGTNASPLTLTTNPSVHTELVALKSQQYNKYVAAEEGQGYFVNANRDRAGSYETWTITYRGDETVTLESTWDRYMRAVDGGGAGINGQATSVGTNEISTSSANRMAAGSCNRRLATMPAPT